MHNVALDSPGRVFICDDENDRVQIFDRAGGFLTQWGFADPSGIAIRNDIVYVSDLQPFRDDAVGPGRCRVNLWTLDGAALTSWLGTDFARAGFDAGRPRPVRRRMRRYLRG